MTSQANRQRYKQDPKEDRVGSKHPQQSEESRPRPEDDEKAEQDRQDAIQDQEPLAMGAMEVNRRDNLQDARHDPPSADQVEQGQRGECGLHERDDPGGNPGEPFEDWGPPPLMPLGCADTRDNSEQPIHTSVGAQEDDKRRMHES